MQTIAWIEKTRQPVAAEDHRHAGKPARHGAIDEGLDELASFGVRVPLQFVWSIDGSGVEEDAPWVVHLHRGMLAGDRAPAAALAQSERLAAIDLRAAVRHEIGHALLFARPAAGRGREFRARFGDVARRYRVGGALAEVTRRLERHGGLANPRYRDVVSLYAAAHPHEQFAEAVRVALATRGDLAAIEAWAARHGAGPRAVAQIVYAAQWLRDYRY